MGPRPRKATGPRKDCVLAHVQEVRAAAGALNPKLYEQVLRNENFKPLWDNADYRALGDYSRFKPLAPSVSGAGSMPMPVVAK